MNGEYGHDIIPGRSVELHPGCDLWMQGARFGVVQTVKGGIARVKMDHPSVKRTRRFPLDRLRRINL